MSRKITMSKRAFMKEHKHLLKVLKSGKGMKKEASEQEKEMAKYFKRKEARKPR